MGVIKRGILGGFRGKVANVVGTSWKGIAIMKSLPLSVANPRTAGQVAQRNKFNGVLQVASLLLAQIVKPLWDRFAQGQSGYNAFISANINCWVGDVFTNISSFIISRGNLLNVNNSTASFGAATTGVSLTWDSNAGTGNALASDLIKAVVYNEDKDFFFVINTTANRAAEVFDVTEDFNTDIGDVLHLFYSFVRADGSAVSDTNYQTVTVAS